jgi:hypothetical protein
MGMFINPHETAPHAGRHCAFTVSRRAKQQGQYCVAADTAHVATGRRPKLRLATVSQDPNCVARARDYGHVGRRGTRAHVGRRPAPLVLRRLKYEPRTALRVIPPAAAEASTSALVHIWAPPSCRDVTSPSTIDI